MNRSDSIVSMLYLKKYILVFITYSFCTGKYVSKDIENIKERIAYFTFFKEGFEKMKSYATRFRLAFYCGRSTWKLLLKIKNLF